jgi:hypothetical protein
LVYIICDSTAGGIKIETKRYEENPKIEVRYNNSRQLIGVSLLDPKGERFEIPIEVDKSEEKVECKPKCHRGYEPID